MQVEKVFSKKFFKISPFCVFLFFMTAGIILFYQARSNSDPFTRDTLNSHFSAECNISCCNSSLEILH